MAAPLDLGQVSSDLLLKHGLGGGGSNGLGIVERPTRPTGLLEDGVEAGIDSVLSNGFAD